MDDRKISVTSQLVERLTRFVEAATVAGKWRKVRAIESRLERDLTKAFKAQGKAFSQGFASLRGKFKESISDDDWVGIYDEVARTTEQLFINPIERAVQLTLSAAAEELIATLDVDYSFSLKNPRAVAYATEHGAELVRGIGDTTRDYLRTVIRQGVDEGWSYNRIARAITERYAEFATGVPQEHIKSRAHLIAVTEIGNAYEAGNEIVIQDLADAGLRMEKSWSTINDNRVDPECRANEDAGWIPADEAFPSGHMRPLAHPACRCTALYRRARG